MLEVKMQEKGEQGTADDKKCGQYQGLAKMDQRIECANYNSP